MARFIALGNGVWLDEIWAEGRLLAAKDVPGGSVTFASLGARLFTSYGPASISLVFNAGRDFPDEVINAFRSWSVDLTVHRIDDKPASRGAVFYSRANQNRKEFQRLTEPLPVTVRDLQGTHMLRSCAFHFFGTPEYIEQQTSDLKDLKAGPSDPLGGTIKPFVIWEPLARLCRPENLRSHQEALKDVDVFSPNHEELADLFDEKGAAFEKLTVERQAKAFITSEGWSFPGCMVVRAAEHGCLVLAPGLKPVWLPSFYRGGSSRVVDATGAGNAFLGAFAIGWQEKRSYVEAAKYGQVAASFAIEQFGLPNVAGQGDEELWNDCSVKQRLADYLNRTWAMERV